SHLEASRKKDIASLAVFHAYAAQTDGHGLLGALHGDHEFLKKRFSEFISLKPTEPGRVAHTQVHSHPAVLGEEHPGARRGSQHRGGAGQHNATTYSFCQVSISSR